MKRNITFAVLFILGLSLSACSKNKSSFDSSSSEETSSDSSGEESSEKSSSNSLESSASSSVDFPHSFQSKEQGLTLEKFTNEISKIDPQPQEQRKVRYTWHITEKLTGNYYNTMLDGSVMPEGEIVGDFVSETKKHNLDANIQLISGTPVTQMQKYHAMDYTSSVTPQGWLSYHEQRRSFLQYAQEGEGFEERFYTKPTKLWMAIWGNRPANAQIDGTYFSFQEYERLYNDGGYCTSFIIREYTYIKGTLSTYNNGDRNYDGSYEYTCNCAIEYLD